MDTYKTKDIFEAAWIFSQQIRLIKLEPGDKYSWFVFDQPSQCQMLSSSYWSQSATGNIRAFVNSYKTLKDLVFSKR